MTIADFTEDEYDALRETVNRAMGTAGAGLADLLSAFVELSIPEVEIVAAEALAERVSAGGQLGGREQLTAIRQTFYGGGDVDGEAIVVFDESSPEAVSRLIGVGRATARPEQVELLLEMSNLIIGACLNGISMQLFGQDMTFDPPAVLAERMDLRAMSYNVFQRRQLRWNSTLSMKIQFKLEKESLKSDLIVLLSEKSIDAFRAALDRMIAEL